MEIIKTPQKHELKEANEEQLIADTVGLVEELYKHDEVRQGLLIDRSTDENGTEWNHYLRIGETKFYDDNTRSLKNIIPRVEITIISQSDSYDEKVHRPLAYITGGTHFRESKDVVISGLDKDLPSSSLVKWGEARYQTRSATGAELVELKELFSNAQNKLSTEFTESAKGVAIGPYILGAVRPDIGHDSEKLASDVEEYLSV